VKNARSREQQRKRQVLAKELSDMEDKLRRRSQSSLQRATHGPIPEQLDANLRILEGYGISKTTVKT
jgi:hypothetical protein